MHTMTVNSINYGNLLESRRHNRETERELNRSNLEKETETRRSNLAREYESRRSNAANESLKQQQLEETKRANVTNEGIQIRKQKHYESTVWPQEIEQKRFGHIISADPYDWLTFAATGGDIQNAKLSDFTNLAQELIKETSTLLPDLGAALFDAAYGTNEAAMEGGKKLFQHFTDKLGEEWTELFNQPNKLAQGSQLHVSTSGRTHGGGGGKFERSYPNE